MQDPERVIDEQMLAAFLAGTLTEEGRQEVVDHLASDTDAREVLQMAVEALEAARHLETRSSARAAVRPTKRSMRPSRSRAVSSTPWLIGAGRYAGAAAIVLGMALLFRLSLDPRPAAVPPAFAHSEPNLYVEVNHPGPTIRWTRINDAYVYRLVVWDPGAARVIARYETADNVLATDHPLTSQMRVDLSSERSYSLRIDAVDPQNRLVRSSDIVELHL